MLIAAVILIIIAMVSYLWLMVEGFKKHIVWGIGIFFIPFISIVFAVVHWKEAKKPFLINLLSSILLVAVLFEPMTAAMKESVQVMQRVETGELTEQQAQQMMVDRMRQILMGDTVTITDDDLLTPEEQEIQALQAELKIKNDAARASQAYAQEQASKRVQVEKELRKVNVFTPIKLSQAKKYVGQKLRIVSFEGIERQGILRSAGFDRLTLDRKLAGGQFNFDVLTKDIKTIEVQKEVLK